MMNIRAMNVSVRKLLCLAALTCAFQDAAAIPFTAEFKPAPKLVREYFLTVKDAALGGEHSVLVLENGKLIAGFNRNHPIIGLTKAGSIEGDPGTYFHPFKHVLKMELTSWEITVVTADGKLQSWSGKPVLAEVMRSVKPSDVKFIRGGENAGLCALKSGRLLVWGWDFAGHLQFGAPSKPKRLTVEGDYSFFVIREDGMPVTFGKDFLSDGNMISPAFPLVSGKVKDARTFSGTTFVISDHLWAFGIQDEGLLDVPKGLKRVEQVAVGVSWAVARTADGKLWKWGERAQHFKVPVTESKCVSVTACNQWGVSLHEDGSVIEWGDLTPLNGVIKAQRPVLPKNIKAVEASWEHVLALSADGKVFAWGRNSAGECKVPADMTGAVAVAGGWNHSAALLGDGRLRVWGDHLPPAADTPALVSVAAGNNVTAGITKDGGVVVIDGKTGKAKRIPLFGVFDRP